jgi:hypothetical protein
MKLLEDKTIKIGGKEYTARMTMRTMINFEKLSGHSIDSVSSLEDGIMLFYSAIKKSAGDLTYDQFLDLIDEDMEVLNSFTQWAFSGNAEKKPIDQ